MNNQNSQENPLVSVIIPCFNYGKYVQEAIDSVLAQTYQNFEIIVVNDGSTDQHTIKVLNSLNKPKTRVIHQHNQGLATTRNNAIKQARGRYILPLDADDKIDKTYLEKSVWVMQTNPRIGFVYTLVRLFGDTDQIWYTKQYNYYILLNENIISVTALFRKEAFYEVGGYNPNMIYGYEDWNFWIDLGKRGWYGKLIEEPLMLHRKHGRTMTKEAQEKHDFLVKQIKQNHPEIYNDPIMRRKIMKEWNVKYYTCKLMVLKIKPLIPFLPKEFLKNLYFKYLRSFFLSIYYKFYFKFKKEKVDSLNVWVKHPIQCFIKIIPQGINPFYGSLRTQLSSVNNFVPFVQNQPVVNNIPSQKLNFHANYGTIYPEYSHFINRKIGVLLLMPWLKTGGVEKVTLSKIKGLKKYYNFHILTFLNGDDHEMLEEFEGHVHSIINISKLMSEDQYFLFIKDYVSRKNIKLIHIIHSQHGYNLLPYIRSEFSKMPLIDTLHNDSELGYIRYAQKYSQYLNKHLVISNLIKNRLNTDCEVDRNKTEVVYNGVDQNAYANTRTFYLPDMGGDKKIISFIGRFSPEKRPHIFVQIARLLKKYPEFHFVMAGDGPLFNSIRKQIFFNGMRKRFSLPGNIKEIPELLSKTFVLVNTSHTEGMPLTILEAFAAGTPVVVPRVGAVEEVIKHENNGIIVGNPLPQEYAASIKRLIDDAGFYRMLKNNISSAFMSGEFTRDKMLEKYQNIYRQLIG